MNSTFNDIYIMYLITTNCNLRCYGCIQNCDKFQSEEYVDLETFQKHMNILKKSLPHMTHLCLQGGEALLHKQLIQLCEIAHNSLPGVKIDIYTNGILLNTLKDKDLKYLNDELNITFYLSLYPKHEYFNIYKKQLNRLSQLNIQPKWQGSHVLFTNFTLARNPVNTEVMNNTFKTCQRDIQDKQTFLIKNNYLYLCCPSISVIESELVTPENNQGCILLDKLINEEQIIQLASHPFETCKFCALNFQNDHSDLIYWQEGKNFNYKRDEFLPLSKLYIQDYDKYEKLTSTYYDLPLYLSDPFFYEHIENETGRLEFNILLNKCYNGFLDIFIPFNNEFTENKIIQLKQLLQNQSNIEKCNLYFVAYDNDINTQELMYTYFTPYSNSKLNIYFLKGKNLYEAHKKFLENSFIKNKYYFELKEINQLKNKEYLNTIIFKEVTK